jgi:two-component system OmpR family response regulator
MYLHTVPIPKFEPPARPPGEDGEARVLVVDGDPASAAELSQVLSAFGIAAEIAGTAQGAEGRLLADRIDVVVIEVDLPGEDGLGLCRRLSRRDAPPILVLSRRCDVLDRIIGLEYGADDYLAKTAHPLEIVARIKALRRRWRPAVAAPPPVGWILQTAERRLQGPDGRGVRLSATEFRFLAALFPRVGEMVGREDIVQAVYGGSPPQPRSIDVLASRVRRRLSGVTRRDMITCVRGAGYMLEAWPSDDERRSSTHDAFDAR